MIAVPLDYVRVLRACASGNWTAGPGYLMRWVGDDKCGNYCPVPSGNTDLCDYEITNQMRDRGLIEQRLYGDYIEFRLTPLGQEALAAI